jgi:hypothetical protein
MKSLFAVALFALVAAGCNKAAFPETKEGGRLPDSIMTPYLNIEKALADDSTDGIRQNAGELTTAATALGAPAMRIQTEAAQMASAGDLEDARTKFANLSVAIDNYMKGFKMTPPDGVRVAFCPMKQKPWLQEGDIIKNPYFGSEMPTCGEFR